MTAKIFLMLSARGQAGGVLVGTTFQFFMEAAVAIVRKGAAGRVELALLVLQSLVLCASVVLTAAGEAYNPDRRNSYVVVLATARGGYKKAENLG